MKGITETQKSDAPGGHKLVWKNQYIMKNFHADYHHYCNASISVLSDNKNSSGDEIANVNFYTVRPEATRIR